MTAADVDVVGAGTSGSAFAWGLTQAGIKAFCLEQGG
ncbi:MAG: NAD(P)-binding protein [Chloroflexi bacterium]|nr:NAD(P)-binding protein [Chloroflexota bacterium]